MKLTKILPLIAVLFLFILAIAPLSEAATSDASYSQGQSGGSKTVTKGDLVGIQVTSNGFGEKLQYQELYIKGGPNGIDQQLFRDTDAGTKEGFVYEYGRTYDLNTSNYDVGTYTIEFIAKGRQSSPTSHTLKLTINPVQQQDNNAPSITISDPQSQTYNSQVTELNYTPTDAEGNLDECWYSTDGGQTNSSRVNCNDGVLNTFSGLASQTGQNNWTVYASDTEGNIGSASVTFTYQQPNQDNQAPNVDIEYPQNTTYSNHIGSLRFRTSDNQDNSLQCWYSTDGGQTNSSKEPCNTFAPNHRFGVNSVQGTNEWTVWAEDSAGNVGKDTVQFTVNLGGQDTTPPQINPLHPQDSGTLEDGQTRINVSTNEEANVKYFLDGVTNSNISMNSDSSGMIHESPVLHNLEPGKTYSLTYYAEDKAGNTNNLTIAFSIEKNESQPPLPKDDKDDGNDDDFTPGQGEYYNHEKDQYLDQFDNQGDGIVIEDESSQDRISWSNFNLSWLLPLLAVLVGLTLIAIAIVLGSSYKEEKRYTQPYQY